MSQRYASPAVATIQSPINGHAAVQQKRYSVAMTDQLVFDEEELLASHAYIEPLVVGGERYHGGFVSDGTYVSPRTRNRWPAIRAWQDRVRTESDMELIDCPGDLFAEFYPNLDQTKYLLAEGVRDPVIQILTQIGTVEGFGSVIRHVELHDLQRQFVEDITGTATAHLNKGLYEAHARDESGYEEEGGHQQMWYAVRDLAFENPEVGDPLQMAMQAFTGGGAGGQAMLGMAKALGSGQRIVPQIDVQLETAITRMTGLLLIELLAFNTFKWAAQLVGDPHLCANTDQAAALVGYIRSDEEPHVGYLRTTLTEMRARTFVGTEGQRLPGTDVIDACWNYSIRQMFGLGGKRADRREMILGLLDQSLDGHPRRTAILAGFHDLETPDPVIDEQADTRTPAVGYG